MSELPNRLELEALQESLRDVQGLLHRQHAVEAADGPVRKKRERGGKLVRRRRLAELRTRLDKLHAADVAYILEALPLDERLAVWDLVKTHREGEILLEASDAVRESLIARMDSEELVAAAGMLDASEVADLAPDLPEEVLEEVVLARPAEERERLRAALSYAEGSVGSLVDFAQVTVRNDVSLEVVTRYLRRLDALPDHTDQLFVVDRERMLLGTLPLARLIVSDLELEVSAAMVPPAMIFRPEDSAEDAARAFERYDLITAPVVDDQGCLVGRVTVDAVVDHIRRRSAESQLAEAGLRHEEDMFAPVRDSFKNRWSWLALNLVTALVASRVIGLFEGSIERLVALATLMPIVAGIGGNAGNQTVTMIVRALALAQIQSHTWATLFAKELGVALLNGVVWGSLLGLVAFALYDSVALGGVMALAMLLTLLLAATMGVAIPYARARLGRDPAVGSSVLITACTDSGGFFIFLGLATVFLM